MHDDATPPQLRSFGLLVGGIFAVMGVWPLLWRGHEVRLWALILAALLIVPALVAPRSLRWFHRGWMALGGVLGWINTRIILSVIFYAVFTPMGVVLRLRRDPMRRGWEPDATTYRVDRQPRPHSHMQQQF